MTPDRASVSYEWSGWERYSEESQLFCEGLLVGNCAADFAARAITVIRGRFLADGAGHKVSRDQSQCLNVGDFRQRQIVHERYCLREAGFVAD
ncbi:MAG: hypothetical protein HY870_04705 [Chloroflexi bacterium]|nr:hypothetical protein [Chloroflexota bacterium]